MKLPEEESIMFQKLVNASWVEVALSLIKNLSTTIAIDELGLAESNQEVLLPLQALGRF